ncbi:MAG: c-type cytochrome [Acidobacteriaceae bacterium]
MSKPVFLFTLLPLPILLLLVLSWPVAQAPQQTQATPSTAPAAASTAATADANAAATTPAFTVPPEAMHMVNPVKPTPDGLAHAKTIYGYDCAMCHGSNGNGQGDLAAQMKLTIEDWTKPATLQGKTDGELFYIISNGHGPMPPETGRAKTADIWNMVVLIRSFSKS